MCEGVGAPDSTRRLPETTHEVFWELEVASQQHKKLAKSQNTSFHAREVVHSYVTDEKTAFTKKNFTDLQADILKYVRPTFMQNIYMMENGRKSDFRPAK